MRDDIDIPALRERLLAMRADILADRASQDAAGSTVELDQTRQGRLSRMDALQGQAMAKANAARAKQTLQRIDAALERIEQGDYGWCLECDEPIAAGRLEVNPAVALCIACAEKAED
jgi:DnaK suppressor protein